MYVYVFKGIRVYDNKEVVSMLVGIGCWEFLFWNICELENKLEVG